MKHDMNKLNSFDLTQFEWRIQNLINLQVKRKNLNVGFPATIILNITIANQSIPHFSVIFFGQCALLIVAWLFIVPIFTSWHLRRIKSTLVIWHIVGKPYNWLNFNF